MTTPRHWLLAAVIVGGACNPGGVFVGTAHSETRPVEVRDPANVDMPAFPGIRYVDAIELRIQSRFVPDADLGSSNVDLYQPSLQLRLTTSLSTRAVVRVIVRGGSSLYDFSGTNELLSAGFATGEPADEFYYTAVSLQGALLVHDGKLLFTAAERWSLLAGVDGRFSWESGAFGDAGTGGGSLGMGYHIPGRLRLALGFSVGSSLDSSGVDVSPVAAFRWRITDSVTLRSREHGGQIEYRLSETFQLFAAGFIDSDSYRLDRRSGLPSSSTFRDRQVRAGIGFEWRLSRQFRVNLEVGGVPSRELRVRASGSGSLASVHADASSYADVRFVLRP